MNNFSIIIFLCVLLCREMQLIAAEKLSSGEDVEDYVARKISDADVTVFAKSYCPHCKASRNLLHRLHDDSGRKWTLDIVDLDLLEDHDGPFIQMELLKRSGQKTVPNIYLNGNHVGGNSDLQTMYASGELESMLEQVVEL